MTTVAIELVCFTCKEPWTYEKPEGRKGRHPRTNPAHPKCKTKRENKGRVRRRTEAKAEGVRESERSREGWKLPKHSGVTEDERQALEDATKGHIRWKTSRGEDALTGSPVDWHGGEPAKDDFKRPDPLEEHASARDIQDNLMYDDYAPAMTEDWERFRYIPKGKREAVKTWFRTNDHRLESREYSGSFDRPRAKHVLGSMDPWYIAELPRMGSVQPLPKMEPFVMTF
ncbi:hypothetical protein ACFWY6_09330 [Streptomyces sp. NPDC059037]|uniref:hypothetical protein n=1 Tax=Streptomyces sp. NPDC059037 TaxID=3346710 RepID=UPI0036B4D453